MGKINNMSFRQSREIEMQRVREEMLKKEREIRRYMSDYERKNRDMWQRDFKDVALRLEDESRWEMKRRREELEKMYRN